MELIFDKPDNLSLTALWATTNFWEFGKFSRNFTSTEVIKICYSITTFSILENYVENTMYQSCTF